MNKKVCILLLFGLLAMAQNINAQDSIKAIQISTANQTLPIVRQYTEFKFRGGDGKYYNGKIKIYNDTQFAFYNFFNELSTDTMHISFIQSVMVKLEGQRYKISPGLVVLGLVFTPMITIPVVIFKLFAKRHKWKWVDKEGLMVKVITLYEE
ncbi:MAG: hypothetical protein V4613_03400 [Bacteroidota bacterium]